MSCFVVAACSSTSSPSSEGDVDAGKDGSAFEAGPDDQLFDEAGICSADVTKDPNNCGNCGVACAADEVCSKSTCASACSASLTECSRSCVSLPSDHDHCGVCGNACLEAEGCARGKCRSCDAQPTELLNTATPCEFALPATFAADDVDFSNIIFLKSDMTRITIQQGALDGWAWDDSKAPKAVRLAGAACTAISTYGNPRLAISCRLYPD